MLYLWRPNSRNCKSDWTWPVQIATSSVATANQRAGKQNNQHNVRFNHQWYSTPSVSSSEFKASSIGMNSHSQIHRNSSKLSPVRAAAPSLSAASQRRRHQQSGPLTFAWINPTATHHQQQHISVSEYQLLSQYGTRVEALDRSRPMSALVKRASVFVAGGEWHGRHRRNLPSERARARIAGLLDCSARMFPPVSSTTILRSPVSGGDQPA